MPNTEEQRLDIIEISDFLLEGVLQSFDQTDDTPEGRMITQLKWLKERAENHDLPLPVDPVNLSTLRYVYTDGELCRDASKPDDPASVWLEVERPLGHLLSLTKYARLIIKPPYYPYTLRLIDALKHLLLHAERSLSENEQGLIPELEQLQLVISNSKIELPLISYLPDYPNFRKVFRMNKSSIDDLPNGKYLCKTVANLVFEGVRPDTWLTPEDADRETQNL